MHRCPPEVQLGPQHFSGSPRLDRERSWMQQGIEFMSSLRRLSLLASLVVQSVSAFPSALPSHKTAASGSQAFVTRADTGMHTLTTVREILELSRPEAIKGYPVRIRAVVTYYGHAMPDEHNSKPTPDLFVHDRTGG